MVRMICQGGLAILLLMTTASATAALFSAILPSSRSTQVDTPATVFATISSTNEAAVTGCSVALLSPVDADFSYQTTDAVTNTPTGSANTPVTIPAMGSQSFVLTITANSEMAATDVSFTFSCDNDGPAPTFIKLNTLLFSASATPVSDVIALVATVSNDGIVTMPGSPALGFFTVASVNIGTSSTITVTPSLGISTPAIDHLLICQTDLPGACMSPAAAGSLSLTIDNGATPTFAVFATTDEAMSLDPANNRIFVEFTEDGAPRGLTSVALTGGGPDVPATPAVPAATFTEIQDTILTPTCASTTCHGSSRQGGLSLAPEFAYGNIVGNASSQTMPYIDPGDIENSYLYLKVNANPPAGPRMPLNEGYFSANITRTDPLHRDLIARLASWIEDGAPDN